MARSGGRVPRPTALKVLRGDRADRINDREPIARDVLPEPPEGMSDEVREVWDYTVRELQVMHLASSADRDSLHCFCEAVVTHRKASAILARSPVLIKSVLNGAMIRNPALQVQADAARTIRCFAQEFGLTPSGRSRIQTEGRDNGEQSNPFAAVS